MRINPFWPSPSFARTWQDWAGLLTRALDDTMTQANAGLEEASEVPVLTKAGAFVAADLPEGTAAIAKDTAGGTVQLLFNDGGTLKSVDLL